MTWYKGQRGTKRLAPLSVPLDMSLSFILVSGTTGHISHKNTEHFRYKAPVLPLGHSVSVMLPKKLGFILLVLTTQALLPRGNS